MPVAGSRRMAGEGGKMLVPAGGSPSGYTILENVASVPAVKKRMKERRMPPAAAGKRDAASVMRPGGS